MGVASACMTNGKMREKEATEGRVREAMDIEIFCSSSTMTFNDLSPTVKEFCGLPRTEKPTTYILPPDVRMVIAKRFGQFLRAFALDDSEQPVDRYTWRIGEDAPICAACGKRPVSGSEPGETEHTGEAGETWRSEEAEGSEDMVEAEN